MFTNLRRSAAIFFAAGASAIVVLLGLLVPSAMQANAQQNGNGGAATCTGSPTFYAYQAPNAHGAGSTANFGPDLQVANTKEALTKFDETMAPCTGDPLATSARYEFLLHGRDMDPAVVQSEATKIANDRNAWQAKVDAIRSDITNVELVSIDEDFDSLGMTLKDTPKDMPALAKFNTLPHMNATLKVTTKEGATRHFRISCFFQPSVPKAEAFTQVQTEKVEQKPQTEQSRQPCTTCACAGNCQQACTTCECAGNCVQCTTCECTGTCQQPCTTCACQGNCPQPCTNCLAPKGPSVNNGWTPLPSGPLTNGKLSQQQQQSGQVSGNVTDNKVPSGTTSGSTTPDLPKGTTTAPGATSGGDSAAGVPQDTSNTTTGGSSTGTGGTSGATCITDPDTGARTCK